MKTELFLFQKLKVQISTEFEALFFKKNVELTVIFK